MKVFSVNALADSLERDRATIVRALKHVPRDATEKGQPRWKMATALKALDRLPGSHNSKPHRDDDTPIDWCNPTHWRSTQCSDALTEFNAAFAKMKSISDVSKRRAFAIAKLAPLIDYHDQHFRQWETGNPAPGRFDNAADSVNCRVAILWSQELKTVGAACKWTSDEARKFLYDQHRKAEDD